MRFNLFLYCDLSGAIIHGRALDYRSNLIQPIPPRVQDLLKPGALLPDPRSPDSAISGLLELPDGLMMIVSRPVLTSEYKGPPAGAVVIGRYLDNIEIKALSDRNLLPMQITMAEEISRRADLQKIKSEVIKSGQIFIHPSSDENYLIGSIILKDIHGNETSLLQVTLPRYIYQQGKKTFSQFLVLYGSTAAVFIFIFSLMGVKLAYTLHLERLAQKKLSDSEQRYRVVSLLSSDFAYSCIHKASGRFEVDWITEAFFSITGFSPEELTEQGCWLFCTHENDAELAFAQLNTLSLGVRSEEEFRIRTKDGTLHWLHNVMELQADQKAPNGVRLIGAARKITARKMAEEQIARSLKEKEVLLKEVHHRVKNNMQVIYSLLNLQAMGIGDPTIRAMFEESKNRVNVMAMIHEKLYRSADLSAIDFKEYLHNLVHSIADCFNRPDILLNPDIPPLSLDVNTGIPCGLIINELVTNCFKYAFPGGRRGTITVHIKRDADGSHVLTVADNGIGFPPGVDFRDTTSLGMQLVIVLCGQLNGTIAHLSTEEGCTFHITFPACAAENTGAQHG